MTRLAHLAVLVALLACPARAQSGPDAEVEKGRYLAIAADCSACHTLPQGGQPFAGGYAITSPVGAIYASNITPSRKAGIGTYTESQFAKAVREGVRSDGARLYPAMPYTSYAGLSDGDVHALYAYFKRGVAAVDVEARQTRLHFPFNIRASMRVWNALFFKDRRFRLDPAHDARWNRGAYLVEVLGHCGSCHTPRGLLMAERHSRAYAGGQVGPSYAPNITSDPVSGLGAWSEGEMVRYLSTGALRPGAQAAGAMAEVVEHSLQYLHPDDLAAMATYLRGLAPMRDRHETQSRFSQGHGASGEAALRGASPTGGPPRSGAMLYSAYCSSCHGEDGRGSRDQHYPALFHNSATGGTRPDNLLYAIVFGVSRHVGGEAVQMPAFGVRSYDQQLSDAQVAAIANHVLANFGNAALQVTDREVAQTRAGGPTSVLVRLMAFAAPAGLLILLLIAFALLFWQWRRRRRS